MSLHSGSFPRALSQLHYQDLMLQGMGSENLVWSPSISLGMSIHHQRGQKLSCQGSVVSRLLSTCGKSLEERIEWRKTASILVSSMHWVLGRGYQLKLDEMEGMEHWIRKRVIKFAFTSKRGTKGPAAGWSISFETIEHLAAADWTLSILHRWRKSTSYHENFRSN